MTIKTELKKIVGGLVGILLTLLLFYLLDTLPNKWAVTLVAAYVFVMISIIIGDVKHSLFFLLIVGIPLNLQFMLMSRDQARITTGGIFLSIVNISVIGLIFLWVIGKKSNNLEGDERIRYYPRITKPALVFLGANILSLLVSNDKTWCVYGIINVIKLFSVFFVVANSINTKREMKYVMSFMLISLFIQSGIYIVQHYTGLDFNIVGQSQSSGEFYGETRVRGLIGQANASGEFFSACLVTAIGLYFIGRRVAIRALIGITLALGVYALIITLTRAAWLSFALSSMIFVIIGFRRRWVKFRVVVPALVVLIVIIINLWDPITSRFRKDDAGSAYSRIPSMIVMMRMIEDHPILGVGVNNYISERIGYLGEDVRGALRYPHNQYLLVFAETGIIGFFSFMFFLYRIFKEGIRIIKSDDCMVAMLVTGVILSIFAICICMLTDAPAQGPVAVLTWFLSGIVAAAGRIVDEEGFRKGDSPGMSASARRVC